MKEETAKVAAKWWADKLRDGNPNVDIGDKEMNFNLLVLRSLFDKPSEDQTDAYEIALCEALLSSEYDRVSLYVDYHPEGLLDIQGFDLHLLPFKTGMIIENDTISVKEGYGNPYNVIYEYRETEK